MRNDERLRTIYEVMAPYIVRSERNWRDYLAFASRFHKQSFDNILLVYAQDEDVTILASKKQWASVGRNLISRPKGIAVCVYSNARLTLDYLFDISQTVGREIHPTNWRLSDEMQKALGERLTFSHGFQAQPFPDLLYALARESVNDNYEHYLQGLRQETKNHLFEEIPAGGFEAQYIQRLTDSVSYFIGKVMFNLRGSRKRAVLCGRLSFMLRALRRLDMRLFFGQRGISTMVWSTVSSAISFRSFRWRVRSRISSVCGIGSC